MSNRSRRLDRPFRALTAKARAAMVLRFWRRGLKLDKAILSTMPDEDGADFNQRIDLIRAANEQAPYIRLLREWVAGLDAKFELVNARRRLGEDMRALGAYIRESVGEPVTENEYRCREQELRAELVPLHELVEIAIERSARRTNSGSPDDAGERVLHEEAWTRARGEIEQELIELFRRGTLKGEDRDTGVHISAGSFYDWLGEPMPAWSESGCAYEIFPDSQAEEVASKQRARRSVEELITSSPGRGDLPLALEDPGPDGVPAEMAYALLERMDIIALRDGIQERWRELRCLEIVLAELAAKEFNGEDPLRVETRKVLRAIRTHLVALREKVQLYGGAVALPRPTTEDLALMRKLMARSANRSRPVSR